MRKKKQETKQKKNAGRDLPTRKRKKNQTTKRWDSLLASPIGNCSVLLRYFFEFFFWFWFFPPFLIGFFSDASVII